MHRLHDRAQHGDRRRPGKPVVHRGPLGGAGFYSGMSGRQRVEVLLAFLGGYRNVTLAKGDIAPVG